MQLQVRKLLWGLCLIPGCSPQLHRGVTCGAQETRKGGSAYIQLQLIRAYILRGFKWGVGGLGAYVHTRAHSVVYNSCTVGQWLRTNGLGCATEFNFQFIFWGFRCYCLFFREQWKNMVGWFYCYQLLVLLNCLNFHRNIILVALMKTNKWNLCRIYSSNYNAT